MKIVFISIVVFIFTATSCSTIKGQGSAELKNTLDLDLHLPETLISGEEGRFKENGISGTIRKLTFKTVQEAQTYAMERRLLIVRKFETLVEPYFGTANAKECGENLKSDLLQIGQEELQATLHLVTKGPDRIIHDCLVENNTDFVHIEMLTCKNNFYDIRLYRPLSEKPFGYQAYFKCGY